MVGMVSNIKQKRQDITIVTMYRNVAIKLESAKQDLQFLISVRTWVISDHYSRSKSVHRIVDLIF